MQTKTVKFYQVQESLQTLLVRSVDSLPVGRWKDEVENGTISEQALRVFIAMGWVQSSRDSRLSLIEDTGEVPKKLKFPENEVPVKPLPNPTKV